MVPFRPRLQPSLRILDRGLIKAHGQNCIDRGYQLSALGKDSAPLKIADRKPARAGWGACAERAHLWDSRSCSCPQGSRFIDAASSQDEIAVLSSPCASQPVPSRCRAQYVPELREIYLARGRGGSPPAWTIITAEVELHQCYRARECR